MSDEKAPHRDPVRGIPWLYKLSRMKPTTLVVHVGDEKKTLPIPRAGNKWQRLRNVLDPIPWEVIEAYDAKKNYLGRVENPDHERDDDDADDDDEEEGEDGDDGLATSARIMSKLVKDVLAEARKMNETAAQRDAAATQSMVEAFRAVAEAYSLALKVQATAAATASMQGGSDGNKPALPPEMMMMLMAALNPPPPAPPPRPIQPPAPAVKKETP